MHVRFLQELAYRTEVVSVDEINAKIGIKWVYKW